MEVEDTPKTAYEKLHLTKAVAGTLAQVRDCQYRAKVSQRVQRPCEDTWDQELVQVPAG